MHSSASPASASGAPTRAHACVLCQQRKVKCSRASPCSSCIKSRAECVYRDPAPPRRRKRRSPEAVLLAKLKRYEELLENAGVKVDPIGPVSRGAAEDDQLDERESRQASAVDSADRNQVDQTDEKRSQFGDILLTESGGGRPANPARFISEEGRSRYLEK
jgi:hypothetical protein